MAVTLAYGQDDVEELIQKAKDVAALIKVD
jgi:hypothetical protein